MLGEVRVMQESSQVISTSSPMSNAPNDAHWPFKLDEKCANMSVTHNAWNTFRMAMAFSVLESFPEENKFICSMVAFITNKVTVTCEWILIGVQ